MKCALLIVSLVFLSISNIAVAGQFQQSPKLLDAIGASVSFVANDAGKGSDFDASVRFNIFAEKKVTESFSFQAGLSQTTQADHSDQDNTGEYNLAISNSDVFAGAKFTFNPQDNIKIFAHGGALYYYSQIELKESFFGLKDSGSDEEIEEGAGFYIGAGAAFSVLHSVHLELYITHLHRNEFFEGATRSFDFKETGVSFGFVYTLP